MQSTLETYSEFEGRYDILPGGQDSWDLMNSIKPVSPGRHRDHLIPFSLCVDLFQYLATLERTDLDDKSYSYLCANHTTNILQPVSYTHLRAHET